jgi:hypothetical protein
MGYSPLITSQQSKVGSNGKSSNPCLQSTDRESRGLTTAEGNIIERVGAGTPARWASNYENALTPLECRGDDSRGAAHNARRRWWLE